MSGGWIYIMTNKPNGILYIGVSSDIARRAYEHREGLLAGLERTSNAGHALGKFGSFTLKIRTGTTSMKRLRENTWMAGISPAMTTEMPTSVIEEVILGPRLRGDDGCC
jgi:hypothetical protein